MNMAIAWCELMIGKSDLDNENMWPKMQMMTPEEALLCIQESMSDEIKLGTPGKHAEALADTDTIEFRQYLGGKLGLM